MDARQRVGARYFATMQFSVAAELHYNVLQSSTIILNVHALQTPSQQVTREHFVVEPRVRTEEFLSATGESRFVKLETGNAKKLKISYTAQVATAPRMVRQSQIESVAIAQLDRSVIPYLFPSRYCQSDRLGRLAWGKFGKIERTYDRVVAIVEWIHKNVEYLRGETNSETSAFDTITQRAGVCRDFAHLGIALCRALSIPARYFSGYAYQLDPPDFHACFEVFIGDQWYFFDATKLVPLNGLVRVATGRDAADASIATIFGAMQCTNMRVSCEAMDGPFSPWTHRQIKQRGVVLDGQASPVGP
jgi:transglutaminase-like putative cysteine protease